VLGAENGDRLRGGGESAMAKDEESTGCVKLIMTEA
jgi:hypothetical protein